MFCDRCENYSQYLRILEESLLLPWITPEAIVRPPILSTSAWTWLGRWSLRLSLIACTAYSELPEQWGAPTWDSCWTASRDNPSETNSDNKIGWSLWKRRKTGSQVWSSASPASSVSARNQSLAKRTWYSWLVCCVEQNHTKSCLWGELSLILGEFYVAGEPDWIQQGQDWGKLKFLSNIWMILMKKQFLRDFSKAGEL